MFEKRMGRNDSLITPDQAAKFLGVGRPQVYRYQREGLLTAHQGDGEFHLLFDRHEVAALAKVRESKPTILELQKTLLSTLTRCGALEHRLDLLERVICVRNPNLGNKKSEVEELMERICDALKEPPTDILQILDWCSIFLGVKEEYLHLVQTYTDNPEPWAPFLLLAERMDDRRPSSFDDEDLLGAYLHLTVARRALRQTVFFYLMERRTPAYAQEVIPEAATSLMRRLNTHLNR